MVSRSCIEAPDLSAMHLWVDLKGVPNALFSYKGLKCLTRTTGKFVRLHPHTEKCTRLDVAHVLVEVNLHEPLVEKIEFKDKGGEQCEIDVKYPWLPPRCTACKGWGHKGTDCKQGSVSILKRGLEGVRAVKVVENGEIEANLEVVEMQPVSLEGIQKGGNVVSDLLRELTALPTGTHSQGEKHIYQLEGAGFEDTRNLMPRLQITEPVTERFFDSEEENWKLVSGKAHSPHAASIHVDNQRSLQIAEDDSSFVVSSSRFSPLLEDVDEEEEHLEDSSNGVEGMEEGELVEDKSNPSKQVTGKGRRAVGALPQKSAKKTIVRSRDLKFVGKQGQTKKSSIRKL